MKRNGLAGLIGLCLTASVVQAQSNQIQVLTNGVWISGGNTMIYTRQPRPFVIVEPTGGCRGPVTPSCPAFNVEAERALQAAACERIRARGITPPRSCQP